MDNIPSSDAVGSRLRRIGINCGLYGLDNDSPGARNLEFLQTCCSRMPEGKRIGAYRSDSAAYQASVFNYCESEGVDIVFAVGPDLDSAVLGAIGAIPEEDWRLYKDPRLHNGVTVGSTRAGERVCLRENYTRHPPKTPIWSGQYD